MEKRVYTIVPRNLDVPTDPPKKVTVTCGAATGYSGHASAWLQREMLRLAISEMPFHLERPQVLELFDDLSKNVAFQFMLTLMVANSKELRETAAWLRANGVRVWEYIDEDKKFPGQLPAAIITEPLDEERAELLKRLRPWRCECNSVHPKSTEAAS